jgi:hypothetical protein
MQSSVCRKQPERYVQLGLKFVENIEKDKLFEKSIDKQL